ncbi:MAG: hypothetical protein U0270_25935 [Labilithrix sp.]
MSDSHTFCALVCAPIPVGHRVEASWLETPSGGFMGGKAKRVALIRDLDAEIDYGEMECFADVRSIRVEPTPLPLRVRSDLRVVERARGRVTSCQVATMGFSEKFLQTTLIIDIGDE